MMGPRCDRTCRYPCAKDHRTKAEKIAAMRDGATTPGERAAAEAAAARHPVKEPPPKPKGVPIYSSHTTSSSSSEGTYVRWDGPRTRGPGAKARPTSNEFADFIRRQAEEYEKALREELLRRAQAEETLRAKGFAMPGDPDFDAGFVPRPSSRRAHEQFETLRQMFREGKIKPDGPSFEEE